MQNLIKACKEYSPIKSMRNIELSEDIILALDPEVDIIDEDLGEMLKSVWKDKGVQETWKCRSSIPLENSLADYMRRIDEIAADKFVPGNQEVLKNMEGSGVAFEHLEIDGNPFDIFVLVEQRDDLR